MIKLTQTLSFDENTRTLQDESLDESISLSYAECAVLSALLNAINELVAKEELLNAGWPDRVVAPSSLVQCVSVLRKKLQPYPEINLKTVARRGYQLCLVLPEQGDDSADEAEALMVPVRMPKPRRSWIKPSLVLALGVLVLVWYFSPDHYVMKNAYGWQVSTSHSLRIGQARGQFNSIERNAAGVTQFSNWQRHFSKDSWHGEHFNKFKSFGLANGYGHSMALCPDYSRGQCAGEHLVNITFPDQQRVAMDFGQFLEVAKEMETRIHTNRIILPNAPDFKGELHERIYNADIYFPSNGQLMVRADLSISLVYDNEDQGIFASNLCLTDENCDTTPVKYSIEGRFTRYEVPLDEGILEVFRVTEAEKNLDRPETVSEAALDFYRQLRKASLSDDAVYYYRFYQDNKSAIWIVPFMNGTVAWMKRTDLAM